MTFHSQSASFFSCLTKASWIKAHNRILISNIFFPSQNKRNIFQSYDKIYCVLRLKKQQLVFVNLNQSSLANTESTITILFQPKTIKKQSSYPVIIPFITLIVETRTSSLKNQAYVHGEQFPKNVYGSSQFGDDW